MEGFIRLPRRLTIALNSLSSTNRWADIGGEQVFRTIFEVHDKRDTRSMVLMATLS
jgi:hypothetical protein